MFKNIKIYERDAVLYFDLNANTRLLNLVKLKGEDAFSDFLPSKKDTYKRLRFSSTLNKDAFNFLQSNAKSLIKTYLLKGNSDFKRLFNVGFNDEFSFKFYSIQLLKQNNGLKQNTQRSIKNALSVINAFFKDKNIKSIDKNEILSFYEFLENTRKKSTIKIYMNILDRLLNLALENGVIDKNPFFNKKYSKVLNNDEKALNPFSESEIITLLKQRGDIGLYLKIALLTGARSGEILALRFSDFDFKNLKININKAHSKANGLSTPKTRNSIREIDCLKCLAFFVEKEKEKREAKEKDLIFTDQKGEAILQFANSYLEKEYKSLLKALNIEYRRAYNTRHSFASLMLSKNEPPLWVSFMLGHKNTQITFSTYAKYIPVKRQNYGSFIENELKSEVEL